MTVIGYVLFVISDTILATGVFTDLKSSDAWFLGDADVYSRPVPHRRFADQGGNPETSYDKSVHKLIIIPKFINFASQNTEDCPSGLWCLSRKQVG